MASANWEEIRSLMIGYPIKADAVLDNARLNRQVVFMAAALLMLFDPDQATVNQKNTVSTTTTYMLVAPQCRARSGTSVKNDQSSGLAHMYPKRAQVAPSTREHARVVPAPIGGKLAHLHRLTVLSKLANGKEGIEE